MLVLSRKQQQEVVIGDNIKITVVKIKGNTVRLGIEAPREVKVIRGELPRQSDDAAEQTFSVQSETQEDDQEQFANVSIVFTDPVERTGNCRSNDAEVLKFGSPNTDSCSISFRQSTPAALKRNRLKQIVESISKSK